MAGRDDIGDVAESTPFDNDDNDFSSDNVQDAIEEVKDYAEGFPRAGLPLVHNGTLSNNDWISYSNLTPSVPIIFPVNSKIHELTWANNRDNVSFDLEIYNLTGNTLTLIDTLEVRNSTYEYGYFDTLSYLIDAGDGIRIRYKDQGINTRDLCLVIWFSRVV